MWRVLHGLPRVLRPPISSAAGNYGNRSLSPWLQQEEGTEAEVGGSSVPGLPGVTSVGTQPFVVRLRSDGRGYHHGSKEKVKQDFWLNFDTKDLHGLFDVIGWGSAILLGFQLCRHLSRDMSGEGEGRRLTHSLYKLAFSLPPSHLPPSHLPPSQLSVLPSNDRKALPPSHLSQLPPSHLSHRPPSHLSHLPPSHPSQQPSDDSTPPEERPRHRSVAAAAPLPETRLPSHQAVLQQALAEFETATRSCSAAIQHAIGLQLAREGDIRHAVDMFRMASAAGSAKAQYNLGVCYEQGRGVDRDMTKAAELYQRSAEQGHGRAQYNLAMLYLRGAGGLPYDSHRAVDLMERAAAQGVQQAQSYLGVYWTMEPHRDMLAASQHFSQAAQQKHVSSQFHLGICYERGWGVGRDLTRAAELYMSAAAAGHTQAAHNLAVLQHTGQPGDAELQDKPERTAPQDKPNVSPQLPHPPTQAAASTAPVPGTQSAASSIDNTPIMPHVCCGNLQPNSSAQGLPCASSAVPADDPGVAGHNDLGDGSHNDAGNGSHGVSNNDIEETSNNDLEEWSNNDLEEASRGQLDEFYRDSYKVMSGTAGLSQTAAGKLRQLAVR